MRKYDNAGVSRVRILVLVALLVVCVGSFSMIYLSAPQNEEREIQETQTIIEVTSKPIAGVTEVIHGNLINEEPEPTVEVEAYGDPNNYIYPYNLMSADWGSELYESGFKYYEIPEKYVKEGGCFPEVVQAYLWCICEEYDVDYYMVVALIEKESRYKYSALGDNGNSKGYMQIYEKWHKERMEDLGVNDLFNPYHNLLVGVDTLAEIQSKYLESSGANCCLMVYNMGESTAKSNWKAGYYSTAYSRYILQRAEQIKQEIQDQ